jgi:nuclear GTP-binding protein
MRTRATINRLRMYRNFKPKRDSKGKVIRAAPFQSWHTPGTVARVEPHRKWFGNTRVIGQQHLQQFQVCQDVFLVCLTWLRLVGFQEYMGKAIKDPFQVVMRQTRLPISLLQEKAKQQRVHIVDTESFEHTFGKRAKRKRPNLKATDLEVCPSGAWTLGIPSIISSLVTASRGGGEVCWLQYGDRP